MQEKVIRINSMLIAPDYEMRELGRLVISTTINSKNTTTIERSVLYLNGNTHILVYKGIELFLSLPKNIGVLNQLVDIFNRYGFNGTARHGLHIITAKYERVKKLKHYFIGEIVHVPKYYGSSEFEERREKLNPLSVLETNKQVNNNLDNN